MYFIIFCLFAFILLYIDNFFVGIIGMYFT